MTKKDIIAVILFCFLTVNVSAHPHLFVKPAVDFVADESGISGLRMIWEWDEWWSYEVIMACDFDGDGHLDDNEINLVYKEFFSALKSFNYFTEITVNGDRVKIDSILDFHAEITDESIVIYSFVIPVDVDFEKRVEISIVFNDETIFTAFENKIKFLEHDKFLLGNIRNSRSGFYGVRADFELVYR